MDLKQLEYFAAVAGTGSFTRASAQLGVDQPALSKQVRRLEVELRQTLFSRHGRGVALTAGGELVLRQARKVLNAVAALRQGVDAAREAGRGAIVIATPPTTRQALTEFVSAFRTRFPQASLEILEGRGRRSYEWLSDRRADIGILHDPSLTRGVETIPLPGEPLYLVSRPDSAPVAPSAELPFRKLAVLPLILADERNTIRRMVEAQARRLRIRLRVVLKAQGGPLMLDLVQQGHGHAILPAASLASSNVAGRLQLNEIVQPRLTRSRSLAIATNRPQTPLLKETVKLLEQHLCGGSRREHRLRQAS